MTNRKRIWSILLMLIVALGLVRLIAVPHYQQFARMAKQSEARAQLMVVRDAQAAYYKEFSKFASTLAELNLEGLRQFTESLGSRYILLSAERCSNENSFHEQFLKITEKRSRAADPVILENRVEPFLSESATFEKTLAALVDCPKSDQEYVVYAIGDIGGEDESAFSRFDVWSVDQTGNLKNILSSLSPTPLQQLRIFLNLETPPSLGGKPVPQNRK